MENNRFLRILWSVNGVLLLGIFIVAGFILLTEFLNSLTRYSPPEVIVGKELEDAKEKGLILQGLEYDEPRALLHSTGYILPVSVKTYRNPKKSDGKLRIGSVYKAEADEEYNISNLVFLDKDMAVQGTLLNRKAFISSFRYPGQNEYGGDSDSVQRNISYEIAFADSNQDGTINYTDDADLYITDLSGNDLTQVTRGVDVTSYNFIDSNRILIKYTRRTKEEQEHKKEYFAMYFIKEKNLKELVSLHNTLDQIESQLTK
jgi:hypothetical protein